VDDFLGEFWLTKYKKTPGGIRQGWAGGLSLRQIVNQLNERLVLSKDGGTWQANTVRRILARA